MAQKNKAVKSLESIFPEITEEQTEAVNKIMEKQAEEHSAEIAKLQEQLSAANNQIKEFQSMNIDEIKASAAAWQEKYAASEKAWNEKLAGLKYEAAAKDAVADIKFSSNENDKLIGFSDFLNSYKESDPDAFAPESQNNGNPYLPGVSTGVNLGNTEEMDAAQLQYGKNFFLPSRYSDILLPNFFYNSFLQPGVTYSDRYQMGIAGQIFVPKLKPSEVKLAEPCSEFELLQITLNCTYLSSKKIYAQQATAADYALISETVRLSARELAEAWNKSGIAALLTEGVGKTVTSPEPQNLEELKYDILSARTEMYENKRNGRVVLCSPDFYQLVMQYAGTLYPPSINDRMIYSGEVGEWLGLRFINLNLLQGATAPLEYNNYAWEKKVVNEKDMERVAYILYDPEAFSVLINFSRSRMIESPDFMGQYVQTVLNSGFRVTDDKSIFIRQHTKKEGVRRF